MSTPTQPREERELIALITAHADGYAAGLVNGYSDGWRAANAEMDRVWRQAQDSVRASAATPRYDRLCELRGQHEKAERVRQDWRERGLEVA